MILFLFIELILYKIKLVDFIINL